MSPIPFVFARIAEDSFAVDSVGHGVLDSIRTILEGNDEGFVMAQAVEVDQKVGGFEEQVALFSQLKMIE